jgi:hypothetical protein
VSASVGQAKPASADKRFLVQASPEVEKVEQALAHLADCGDPIALGPWEGGVAEELLYWIPFLRWAVERFALDRERLTAVSRSGVRSWYAGVCDGFAQQPPEGVAALSPELARRVYERFRDGRGAPQELLDRLRFERISREPSARESVAVAFDFGPAFPDTAGNRELAERLADRLRSQIKVVALDGSLEARTAAIAGARTFVGSYGDTAHVALALGVPAIALYSELGAMPWQDVEMAARASWRLGATFTPVEARHAELVAALSSAAAHA